LKDIANARDTTNTIARRVTNMRIRLVKNHIQIRIHKLRDQKQIVSQFIHESDIIQGEEAIYLNDASTKHLTLLVIPKIHILLV
jgi:D-Tyr-tRNAtyr deacylase